MAGWTFSLTNIASAGAFQTTQGGGEDAFIAKFNTSGTLLSINQPIKNHSSLRVYPSPTSHMVYIEKSFGAEGGVITLLKIVRVKYWRRVLRGEKSKQLICQSTYRGYTSFHGRK